MRVVNIYTDGSCLGNPGPGGYGTILSYAGYEKELTGGVRMTTNNRMEIFAAIAGLQKLNRKCTVVIHSDSKLLVDAMSKGWVEKWQDENWKDRANSDLWRELVTLRDRHVVVFRWVKGHNGHRQNERCDTLAKSAARQKERLLVDSVYEQIRKGTGLCYANS